MKIIYIFDLVFVFGISKVFIKEHFGDGPGGRLFSIIGSIASVIIYICIDAWVFEKTEYSTIPVFWVCVELVILFAPIALFLLALLLGYMFDGQDKKN